MVAKGFLAAAAIIICCTTTLQGNDQKTDCTDGKCPTACSKEKCSTEKCSTETTACADGQCDDEKCCEKEKVALEKCATDKCAGSKCAKGECNAAKVAKVAKLKCVTETAAGDEECCEKKKCSAVVAEAAGCPSSRCALQTAVVNECNGDGCPVAACAGQVADALKCAIDVCTSGGSEEICSTDGVCATGACGTSRCATLQTACQDCPAGECGAETVSIEVCNGLKCAVQASITANGGELTFTTERWFPGTQVVEQCSTEAGCSKSTCSTETAAAKNCAGGQCAKSVSVQEIAALRTANQRSQTYVVDVKVIEVNKSKCRNLGFDFEVAGGNAACEVVGQTLEALAKNNLAKVLSNPTLCVTSGRPAGFRAGGEIAPQAGKEKGVSGFVGHKVDVLVSSAHENKVRLEIAPAISELDFSTPGLPQIKTIKWDFACEATLGKPIVLKGAEEQRVVSKTVDGREPIEEVEQIERMLVVTVNGAEHNDLQAEIKQTAYEQGLIDAVKTPEFVTRVYPVPDLQVWKVRPDGVEFDADLLVAHIKSTVDPLSWRGGVYPNPTVGERANGEIQPFERNGSLVICQTEANHEKIAELFRKMRVAGEKKQARREVEERRENGELQVKIEHGDDGVVRAKIIDVGVAKELVAVEKCTKGQCSKGQCSQAKCSDGKCDKSAVSVESECSGKCADECPGDCAEGECPGVCAEQTAERPSVEETSTK